MEELLDHIANYIANEMEKDRENNEWPEPIEYSSWDIKRLINEGIRGFGGLES